ncbi:MAG: hypothetical protein Kow00121_53880 [Elainellaceae cyanobacterium]
MQAVLQVGGQTVTAEDLIPRLKHYQLLPRLKRELIIDQAIAPIECTLAETNEAYQQFITQYHLETEQAKIAFCDRMGFTVEDLAAFVTRQLRIEKFKQAEWGMKLESHYLQRKNQLDQVIYSLIRTKDAGKAQELYFRLQENEQSFAELAEQYSEGGEAKSGGRLGPVELTVPHPQLAQLLLISRPGQLWVPKRIDDWFIIVRLEERISAQFTEALQQRLLQELFEQWLAEQLQG